MGQSRSSLRIGLKKLVFLLLSSVLAFVSAQDKVALASASIRVFLAPVSFVGVATDPCHRPHRH